MWCLGTKGDSNVWGLMAISAACVLLFEPTSPFAALHSWESSSCSERKQELKVETPVEVIQEPLALVRENPLLRGAGIQLTGCTFFSHLSWLSKHLLTTLRAFDSQTSSGSLGRPCCCIKHNSFERSGAAAALIYVMDLLGFGSAASPVHLVSHEWKLNQ